MGNARNDSLGAEPNGCDQTTGVLPPYRNRRDGIIDALRVPSFTAVDHVSKLAGPLEQRAEVIRLSNRVTCRPYDVVSQMALPDVKLRLRQRGGERIWTLQIESNEPHRIVEPGVDCER